MKTMKIMKNNLSTPTLLGVIFIYNFPTTFELFFTTFLSFYGNIFIGMKKPLTFVISGLVWRAQQRSNPQPSDP